MLKRKITQQIEEWRNSHGQQALLVTGARQVGKSFILNAFAREHYDRFISFDLIEQPDLRDAMDAARNADELFMVLSAFGGSDFVPGNTCVLIDEVQECKEAVTLVKYLVGREGFDFMLSGSLLGVELKDVRSQPVGYLRTLEMFPLDFEEFCWAVGVGDGALLPQQGCGRAGLRHRVGRGVGAARRGQERQGLQEAQRPHEGARLAQLRHRPRYRALRGQRSARRQGVLPAGLHGRVSLGPHLVLVVAPIRISP